MNIGLDFNSCVFSSVYLEYLNMTQLEIDEVYRKELTWFPYGSPDDGMYRLYYTGNGLDGGIKIPMPPEDCSSGMVFTTKR